MKRLAIAIPNYNRIDNLRKLLQKIVAEIRNGDLFDSVQICVSDDCSSQDPTEMITDLIKENADIEILYCRKKKNQGMSRNFLDSVLMGDAEFCWIIGNDDIIEDNSLHLVIDYLNTNPKTDFLVTPFDVYQDGVYSNTVIPLSCNSDKTYNTAGPEEKARLFFDIVNNTGIFGFLSNVVFRKQIWTDRKNWFKDKMDSLFIQMYINISALLEGARYEYLNTKIIRNNSDETTNNTIERIAGVLFGLDEVVEYFFEKDYKQHFKTVLTDPFINGKLWDQDEESIYKIRVKEIESPKNELYRKYFVPTKQRKEFFTNREVILFGCGEYGRMAYNNVLESNGEIIAVLDSDNKKIGKPFGDHFISTIDKANMFYKKNCTVVVANHHHLVEMVEKVVSYGLDNIAIIT